MDDIPGLAIVVGLVSLLFVSGCLTGESNGRKAMVHTPALVVTDENGKRTVTVNGVVVTAEDAARLVEFWQKAALAAKESK